MEPTCVFQSEKKYFVEPEIEGPFRTGIKCNASDFAELVERQGIVLMPRLAATFWIRIENSAALSDREWRQYIKKSYDLILQDCQKKKRKPGTPLGGNSMQRSEFRFSIDLFAKSILQACSLA